MELIVRFDYGSIIPWVHRSGDVLLITAGPDTLELTASTPVTGENMKTVAEFTVDAGERESFVLHYRPSHLATLPPIDACQALADAESAWNHWSERCKMHGPRREVVLRSLVTLKALTYEPTGGIIAAPTTSLPEQPGGVRNWDYRYCWLRDATFTLNALLLAGYVKEAIRGANGCCARWRARRRICRFCTASPAYAGWTSRGGLAARLPRRSAGTRGKRGIEAVPARRVRRSDGYAASRAGQRSGAGTRGLESAVGIARLSRAHWMLPDDGIWEVRGPRRHFTHSKVMAWVAFDRAIKDAESDSLEAPVERWREVRDAIHAEVCAKGFDAERMPSCNAMSSNLDASLLLIPQVGFLPPDDARVRGTIAVIERELMCDGFVQRYSTETGVDALPAGEGVFLPCSFWLADAYVLSGRREEGEALFERLLASCNDVGLFAEEYDPRTKHMLGNFPQALTHMALVNTARLLSISTEQAQLTSAKGERPAAAPSEVSGS